MRRVAEAFSLIAALVLVLSLTGKLSAQQEHDRIEPPAPASRPAETAPGEQPRQRETPPEHEASQPTLGPETVRATLDASRRYQEIAESGGWPRVAKPLRPGAKGKAVVTLRRRLAAEGDLPQDQTQSADWDDRLTEAVKRFQARVGQPETGIVAGATLRELNVPAKRRARQLAATAERLERLKFKFGPRYVFVNIPGAYVELVEDGRKTHSYTAIVGGKKNRSPQVAAKIVSIDLNPTWTVPASIIRKELVPKMRRNPKLLERDGIRIFDGRGREVDPSKARSWSKERAAQFTFRQDPGAKNSLGSIRLFMPNRHAVFLHDTPKKQLFDRNYRFLSHGCVRVEGVYNLAARLLDGDSAQQWSETTLSEKIDKGESDKIELRRPVPVVWAYMTGWATPDGSTHFRRDIYDMDKAGAARRKKRSG